MEKFRCRIGGCVVNNQDLERNVRRVPKNGVDAVLGVFQLVMDRDNDGEKGRAAGIQFFGIRPVSIPWLRAKKKFPESSGTRCARRVRALSLAGSR